MHTSEGMLPVGARASMPLVGAGMTVTWRAFSCGLLENPRAAWIAISRNLYQVCCTGCPGTERSDCYGRRSVSQRPYPSPL